MEKHAYLLEVHHRRDLVELLLDALDDERNDIFLHIDQKSKELTFDMFHTKYANLIPVKPMKVWWGDYTQIKLCLHLLKTACNHGHYNYYHLMQGSSYPLKSQDALHEFYNRHHGVEFVNIHTPNGHEERIEKLYLFNRYQRNDLIGHITMWIRRKFLNLQKRKNYNHLERYHLEIKKGISTWSITDDLARYVIQNEKTIQKKYRYSFCGDEFFMSTLVYNSHFREKAFWNKGHSKSSCKWLLTWQLRIRGLERPNHNFIKEDLDLLLNSDYNFARKFEGEDGLYLIEEIKKNIEKRESL